MPTFSFKGRDFEGIVRTGRRNAQSADSLGTQLFKEGITPIEIRAVGESIGLWKRYLKWQETKVSYAELSLFCREMYTLTKSGVTISHAFRQLAESARNNSMRDALNGMAERIEQGLDLAGAMEQFPNVFSPFVVSMIRVGQSSGRLPESFLRVTQYLELEQGAVQNVKSALRYPIFVFSSIIIAIILINLFVIPSFSRAFDQSGMKLPTSTLVLMKMSQFFLAYWAYLLIATVAIIAGVVYWLKTPRGSYLWSMFQLKIPIIGPLIKRIILLRFSQSFAITVSSGVSLIEGIGLVAQSIPNEYGKQKILSMQSAIEHGNSLTQAAAETGLFTQLELQMLAVSEETGELSSMLEQMAAHHKREVEYDLKKLGDLIEPIVIIALAVMILMLAFAVYLPIWNMAQFAHQSA